MKILMAASECVPFIKTGGLADVIGALPRHIADEGEDVFHPEIALFRDKRKAPY